MLLHSLRTGICVRKLLTFPSPPSLLVVNKAGLIAIYTAADPKKVCVYSINGFPVSSPAFDLSKPHSLQFTQQGDHLLVCSEEGTMIIPIFTHISSQTHTFPQDQQSKPAACSLLPSEDSVVRVSVVLQQRREVRERQWTVLVEVLRWTRSLPGARRPLSGLQDKVSPSRS